MPPLLAPLGALCAEAALEFFPEKAILPPPIQPTHTAPPHTPPFPSPKRQYLPHPYTPPIPHPTILPPHRPPSPPLAN